MFNPESLVIDISSQFAISQLALTIFLSAGLALIAVLMFALIERIHLPTPEFNQGYTRLSLFGVITTVLIAVLSVSVSFLSTNMMHKAEDKTQNQIAAAVFEKYGVTLDSNDTVGRMVDGVFEVNSSPQAFYADSTERFIGVLELRDDNADVEISYKGIEVERLDSL